MQLTSLSEARAPDAFSAKKSESESPSRPSAPACRKSRRFRPSQKWTGFAASNWIMRVTSDVGGFYTLGPSPTPADTPSARRRMDEGSALLADDGEEGLHVDEVLPAMRPQGLQQRTAVGHQPPVRGRIRVGLVVPGETQTIDALSGARRLDVHEAIRPSECRH